MRDCQYEGPRQGDGDRVSLLAAEALARMVARDGRTTSVLNESILERVTQAFLSAEAGALAGLRSELRRNRISDADFADHYMPQVARNLGVDWEMDRISFADLSMAVARMQAFLREIGAPWASHSDGTDAIATVLLVVPKGETHTLGPMTLLGQLRRRGVSVCLRVGPTTEELKELLQRQTFDGAIVSVACMDLLDRCRLLVGTLKSATGGKLCVALGGAVLVTKIGVLTDTKADIVTNDLTLVLAAFGKKVPQMALELEHG